jgi:hypothetical protein
MNTICLLCFCSLALAQDDLPPKPAPEPTIESLKKDVADAKILIQQLKIQIANERGASKVCGAVMQAVYQQLVAKEQQAEVAVIEK